MNDEKLVIFAKLEAVAEMADKVVCSDFEFFWNGLTSAVEDLRRAGWMPEDERV